MDNPTTLKILLLGGEGFLGRNITQYLSHKYFCCSVGKKPSIFATDRKDDFTAADPYTQSIGGDFGVVLHLIDNKVAPSDVVKQEIVLMDNLKLKPGTHLILFSSAAVYFEPKSEYAIRKVIWEDFYREYCKSNNIKLTIARVFNVYGPYQLPYRQGSLVANIIINHLRHQPTIINDLEAKRDFTYSLDIAKMVDNIIVESYEGETDLATGKYITVKELTSLFGEIVDETVMIEVANKKESDFCPPAHVKVISSFTDLKTGLRATVDFYQKNLTKIIKLYE